MRIRPTVVPLGAAVLVVAFLLAACTFNPIDNQQVVAGVTTAETEWTTTVVGRY